MNDNMNSNFDSRPRGALEVAMRARSKEKSLALAMADYRAENAVQYTEKARKNKGLIGSLLTIFRAL